MAKRKADEDRGSTAEKLYHQTTRQHNYKAAGGFDPNDDEEQERRERISEAKQRQRDRPFEKLPTPDSCLECSGPLHNSFLWERFSHAVCDLCRDDKGRHKLIARTEAKNQYLLKDCDLDLRKPVLRFLSKKNPHNPRYGDMKLYLQIQVEDRALELHESMEKLEALKEARESNREIQVEKRFEKKIKQIRKEVQGGSLAKLSGAGTKHEHQFGAETYLETEDHYQKTCETCGFTTTYERL